MTELATSIQDFVKQTYDSDCTVVFTRPDEQFGDLATNVAMQLAKSLGKNPRDIAADIVSTLLGNELIEEASVAGPGFINITLKDAVVASVIPEILEKREAYGQLETYKGKTIVTEYSDPNPFKILHAGHLYTTLVGDSISNILANAGGSIHRLNFGGDVGLHVGKSMWAILKHLGGEYPEKLAQIPEAERLAWLSARYVEGSNAYEDDEQAKSEIVETNKRVYQVHAEDDHASPFASIYWTGRAWSYDGFKALYETWGVHAFERFIPESETAPEGVQLVQEGLSKGIFEQSNGAVVYNGEVKNLHTRVFINSEGLPTYEAKDLGLAAIKWRDYNFDLGVIITANDIIEYMKVVLSALSNFYPEVVERSKHITHGVIKLVGGVKMSSRKGNILRAADIISAAEEAAQALGNNDRGVVLGAVKYAFLKQRIGGDIMYDPSESVSIDGNSGPYLQYAYARSRSILSKSTVEKAASVTHLLTDERRLVKKLSEYKEVVQKSTDDLMPHHICTYLFELAQVFNRFYENNRVIGSAEEPTRIVLVEAYSQVLKNGLSLLGITAPEKM